MTTRNPTVISWCPGDKCDPCSTCAWTSDLTDSRIKFVGGSDQIDQDATFCPDSSPLLGLGFRADHTGDKGSMVQAHLDVEVSGNDVAFDDEAPDAPMAIGPSLFVMLGSSTAFEIPGTGTLIDFGSGTEGFFIPGPDAPEAAIVDWQAVFRVFFDCIMVDPSSNFCVYPLSVALPNTLADLAISLPINPVTTAPVVAAHSWHFNPSSPPDGNWELDPEPNEYYRDQTTRFRGQLPSVCLYVQ